MAKPNGLEAEESIPTTAQVRDKGEKEKAMVRINPR